jgi:muramoyltetrapeptide carboxypeptidase
MRKPRALRAGDRIGVVAPASSVSRREVERGCAELRRLGFVPLVDDAVFASEAGYLAGTAELRARAFMRYWSDPDVPAIVAARGGYGSVHLLPLLDPAAVAAQPTLFIGFSDNTSLLSWLTCQCGVSAVHGPMLEGRLAGGAGYDEASFTRLVSGEAGYALKPVGLEVLRPGTASGPLFGGTLTQLVASLGTPFAFDPPEGCVLLIEDVNERPYRLDRMLTQLAQAGVLSRACGIVFGEMRGCDEPGGRLVARDAIARMTHEFDGPILAGFPSGHTTGPTWSLPLGVRVGIAASEHPALVVEEAVVE